MVNSTHITVQGDVGKKWLLSFTTRAFRYHCCVKNYARYQSTMQPKTSIELGTNKAISTDSRLCFGSSTKL